MALKIDRYGWRSGVLDAPVQDQPQAQRVRQEVASLLWQAVRQYRH
jgi:hypothetical protein